MRDLVGDDGNRIADFMLGVLDDETERTETRMQAANWLADRGFGKPTQPQEVELSARTYFDPDEVEKAAESFNANVRRLAEIHRRSAAAPETRSSSRFRECQTLVSGGAQTD